MTDFIVFIYTRFLETRGKSGKLVICITKITHKTYFYRSAQFYFFKTFFCNYGLVLGLRCEALKNKQLM